MDLNLKKWMSLIDGDKNLFSLDIPGTHDCVTQFIRFSHFSKCQNSNIYSQLCLGVRALDIRVQSHGDRLGMVHGLFKAYNTAAFDGQMDMSDVLKQCYKFLDENKSETIVFQFKNDSNKENEKCFNNLFYTYISKNKDKWFLENRVPALDEARGKIVLIRRCKMDLSNSDFTAENTGLDFSSWVEQDKAVPEPLVLETKSKDNAVFTVQDRFKYKPVERWAECVKPFLDGRTQFDGNYVICYLSTAGGLKGPKKNAEYINPQFLQYKIEKSKYYGTVYVDFPTEELTKRIILNNFN